MKGREGIKHKLKRWDGEKKRWRIKRECNTFKAENKEIEMLRRNTYKTKKRLKSTKKFTF